ncbi:hypothetical protein IBE76_10370, partial [Francisella tularensis]|nr:hypothetical protein [Francisella tularensis]
SSKTLKAQREGEFKEIHLLLNRYDAARARAETLIEYSVCFLAKLLKLKEKVNSKRFIYFLIDMMLLEPEPRL